MAEDEESDSGVPDTLERNKYFFGKMIPAHDFEAEARYLAKHRWLSQRLLAGLGIGIILGLVIGFTLFSPFILDIFPCEPEKEEPEEVTPIYENFTKFEGEDTIVYKNEELNVTITSESSEHYNRTRYVAEWIDIDGYENSTFSYYSPEGLYDRILEHAQELSENQLKWFEYMLKNVVE